MDRIPIWMRYIDDIFLIWQGNSDTLQEFMKSLNTNDCNIFVTYQSSRDRIDFLDVTVWRDCNNMLQTTIYRKETSTNSLLHASSAHPKYMINSVPVGQFLRLRRICSNNEDFEVKARDLCERFYERRYGRRAVKRAYHRAKYSTRHTLLYARNERRDPPNKIRFITNYHAQFSRMKECLHKAWPILQADSILKQILPKNPSVTIRRSKNLRDGLVRSHYQEGPGLRFIDGVGPRCGCAPCGRCVACPNIDRTDTFTNSSGSKTYEIRQRITCTTRNVIYFATCPCGLIYIGLTTRQLKVRVREHVLGIAAAADHFGLYLAILRHIIIVMALHLELEV
ncbi:uncharacterized protein [Ranitomeya imitator]|uniref:uncharacterized protein n=1 Tax=Ranitomeya imitator TaxID=111125 RepID=UPI0037E6FA9F